ASFPGASTVYLLAEPVSVRIVLLITSQAPRDAVPFPRRDKQILGSERLFGIGARTIESCEEHLRSQADAPRHVRFLLRAHHAALPLTCCSMSSSPVAPKAPLAT